MSRIELDDTFMDALVKMSDGNPGALVAMISLMEKTKEIDPQSVLGSMAPIMSFDTHEIYGSSIYIIFNDKCGGDVRKTLLLLRAVQLGKFSAIRLKALAADQSRSVNITDDEWEYIDKTVCETLEEFERPVVANET